MAEAAPPDIDYDAWRRRIRADVSSNYHYGMAVAIAREGNRPVAIDHLRRAVAADATMGPAYFELIDLLRAEGRAAEADDAERQARTVCPDYLSQGTLRHATEVARLDRENGEILLQRAAERFPDIAAQAHAEIGDLYLARALEHLASGDDGDALEAMRVSETHGPDNARLLSLRHTFHRDHGEMDEAAVYALRAFEHADPAKRDALALSAAVTLSMALRLKEALALLDTSGVETLMARTTRARLLVALGRPEEAKTAVRTLLGSMSPTPDTQVMLGEILWAADDDATAAALFTRGLEQPGDGAARVKSDLALMAAEAGRFDEAMALVTAIRGATPHVWTLVNVGLALELADHAEEAVQAFRRAVKERSTTSDPQLVWFHATLRPRHTERLFARFEGLGLRRPASA